MADDLFAHADRVEALAAIEAAERAREDAAQVAFNRRRQKSMAPEAALTEAVHNELAAFVEARRRLAEAKH